MVQAIQAGKLKVYRFFLKPDPTCLLGQWCIANSIEDAEQIMKLRAKSYSKFCQPGFVVKQPVCDAEHESIEQAEVKDLLTFDDMLRLSAYLADNLLLTVRRKVIEFQRHDWLHCMRQRRTHYARWN